MPYLQDKSKTRLNAGIYFLSDLAEGVETPLASLVMLYP